MSRRFFPRFSRQDALAQSRVSLPRQETSRRDGLAQDIAGLCSIAVTGTGRPCNESELVTGGETAIFTITGNDQFRGDIATARYPTLIVGLAANSLGDSSALVDASSGAHFALSSNNRVLTYTSPAVATYSTNVNRSYNWTFDKSLFANRAASLLVNSTITVVANA